MAAFEAGCPDLVPAERWRQAVEDGHAFLARWADQAEALGWSPRDLFGLHKPPAKPHPSYGRLSRYDETGLVWLLQGREVVALTEATASIKGTTGAITIYRKHNKPALEPEGDSLDDANKDKSQQQFRTSTMDADQTSYAGFVDGEHWATLIACFEEWAGASPPAPRRGHSPSHGRDSRRYPQRSDHGHVRDR